MADKKGKYTEFRALIEATNKGEPGAAQKLSEYVDRNEWAAKLGDLSILVMDSLMGKLVKDSANRVLLTAQVGQRQAEMGYADASGIERMLIERVTMCWLRLIAEESRMNNSYESASTLKQCEFADRSLSRAQNRLLSACEALERYRLLAQATRIATARADLLDAKAGEARMKKSHAAMRLLKSATG